MWGTSVSAVRPRACSLRAKAGVHAGGHGEADDSREGAVGRQWYGLPGRDAANCGALSNDAKALIGGFTAGYNQYLADAGVDGSRGPWCAGKPWLRPARPEDFYAYYRFVARLRSDPLATGPVFAAVPPGVSPRPEPLIAADAAAADTGTYRRAFAAAMERARHMGSNGWALGAELSESGRGALLANPHFPYSGLQRFWEGHVSVEGVLDVYGGGLVGFPLPNIGFNEHVAWTHTVSSSAQAVLYRLALKPGDPMVYLKDGEERPIEARTLELDVADGSGGTTRLSRVFYFSEFGPMVAFDTLAEGGPSWGTEVKGQPVAFTVFDAAAESAATIVDTWIELAKAGSVADIQEVFAGCRTTYWANVLATDDRGDALHIDAAAVPHLPPAALAYLGRSDRPFPTAPLPVLDGADSRHDPLDGDCGARRVPASQMPQLARRDFVQNANESYWLTHPAAPGSGYSPLYGPTGVPATARTRMNLVMLTRPTDPGSASRAPAGPDGRFNARELVEVVYNNRAFWSEPAVGLRASLEARCKAIGADPVDAPAPRSVAAGCRAIGAWDGRYDTTSRGAHTYRLFLSHYLPQIEYVVPFDPADPVATPHTPAPTSGPLASDPMLVSLARGLSDLDAAGLPYDAPLGDVQAAAAPPDVPGGPEGPRVAWPGGTGDVDGAFNLVSVANRLDPRSSHAAFLDRSGLQSGPEAGWRIAYGTSWHFGLMFTEDGPEAYGLMSYGQAGPSDSSTLEQRRSYARQTPRRLLFRRPALEADPAFRARVIRGRE